MKHLFGLIGRLETILVVSCLVSICILPAAKADTIGGGTVALPAVAPPPAFGVGGKNLVCVQNWKFGTSGTITNMAQMNANFQYHDRNATYNAGWQYGAETVAPDAANAIYSQPIEGVNTSSPVRSFTANSLITYLVPLNGAKTVQASQRGNGQDAGCGSFTPQWTLPCAGSFLGQDIVWETKVRYKTPPYFWFALWNVGDQWSQGAEFDSVESFGYDNGGGNTNYNGNYWHSNVVANPNTFDTVNYGDWPGGMSSVGIKSYDATQYHIWQTVYRHDNSYAFYVDGTQVQSGSKYYWTNGHTSTGAPVDFEFMFDATWGNKNLWSIDHPLPASALSGTYYEFSYSRVYLSKVATPVAAPTGLTQATNNNQVTLHWSASKGATRYYIYRAGDGVNQGFKQIGFSDSPSYKDTFPFNARNWAYYVVAVNNTPNRGGGASLPSNQVTAAYVNLPNNSFETPAQNGGSTTTPSDASWTFTSAGSNLSGVTAGSNSTWGAPAAPDGAQVAFIQNTGAITTPKLWDYLDGVSYVVTGSAAWRTASNSGKPQTINVMLDNTKIGSFTTTSTKFRSFTVGPFTTTSAGHTLSLVGTVNSGLSTVFIDNVQVHTR